MGRILLVFLWGFAVVVVWIQSVQSCARAPYPQSSAGNRARAAGQTGKNPAPASKSIASCSDAMETLSTPCSKTRTIYPHGNGNRTSLEVLCDFETDGGGWTIIQKRARGPKQEFNRTWDEYAKGFGSLDGNFWIGLENIHALTQNGDQELRIQLEDFELNTRWAKYSNFSISDASDFYRLTLVGFFGNSTAGDSMTNRNYQSPEILNKMRFSTRDKDNDNWDDNNCAGFNGGGWWFNKCATSNLNGFYFEEGDYVSIGQGIWWHEWKGWKYSLAKTEMKIRKRKY